MALQSVLIGMMNCKVAGIDSGSVKSASINVKPTYKEHKTGYPQISDLKALVYAEGVCKVETEESIMFSTAKGIAIGLSQGIPIEVSFEGNAPGLGGVALTISGNGFGNASSIEGKSNDFGVITVETTCLELLFTGGGGFGLNNLVGNIPFITPDYTSQARTIDPDNLIFGSPTINNELCVQGSFNATSRIKCFSLSWPPVIEAAVMESTDFNIQGTFSSGDSLTVTDAASSMIPGTVLMPKQCTFSVNTIGGSICSIAMDGIVEPDIGFSPGNDWNGISVKMSAMLTDPTAVGTNWANIS